MLLVKWLLLTLTMFRVISMPDYYWRKYKGIVPPDAVMATDRTYIGRAPFEQQRMLVGPINQDTKKLTVTTRSQFSNATVHFLNVSVEILCGPRPHTSFQWVTTTTDTVSSLSGMVEGGFESIDGSFISGVLYIGRIHYGRTFKLGKVVGYKEKMSNLFFYANDKANEAWEFSSEVLVYKERNTRHKMCVSNPKSVGSPDYYWRIYHGEVPCDALLVTGPTWDRSTYIGRAAFEDRGILVGPIVKGSKYVTVTDSSYYNLDTVHHVDKFVEILCSPFPNKFSWVKSNSKDILKQSGLVEGGFATKIDDQSHKNNVLYVGRTLVDKKFKVGKIVAYNRDNAGPNEMFYEYKKGEHGSESYEVLKYS